MEEAVGYASLTCDVQTPAEHPLVLKHGRYFLITDGHGDIKPAGHCSLGLFEDDTRLLSYYSLKVCGGRPALLSVQSPHSYIGQIDLTITDSEFNGNRWDPKNCVHIRRELLVSDRMVERITLTNYLPISIDYWIELDIGCDFADIFEIRGWKREKRGQFFSAQRSRKTLVFCYQGLDGSVMRSTVQFRQAPSEVSSKGARWQFKLAPKSPYRIEWEISGEEVANGNTVWNGFGLEERHKQMDEAYARWTAQCTRWVTAPTELKRHLDRSTDDLHALYVEGRGGRVITAGIPWYSTAFGRDSIITSIEALSLNPQIAVDTLRCLARYQGEREEPFTEEQPGKIMHELRRGEMARNREIPHIPYYGTIDATPLWLVLLHETWRWTGDDELVRELLPHADRALEWITKYGDIDGDGFVEYMGSPTSKGLSNQGWKDSGDGVPFPDATLPAPPIALVEVQGYVYDALIRTAALFKIFGRHDRADQLRAQAQTLREQIIRHFWIEELGMFALALDGKKLAIPTVTSNAGHLLWSGVPEPWQAERMVEQLMSSDMFCGWGIRTLSAAHKVYNPMSYHNGSVWPHDNAIVVMGMARYGLAPAALPVLRGLHDAAAYDDFQRLPELFCGMARTPGMHPVWYPVSCSPQAWASGAFFMMLQAVLGIQADAPGGVLHIKNPVLPNFLEEVALSKLAIGQSRVSLHFKRHGERTLANLLSVSGKPLQVQIELT
jgi:glycogen debranching enzyme